MAIRYSTDNSTSWPLIPLPKYEKTKLPAAPSISQYYAPTPDMGRIQLLTQEAAAPGVRKLRGGLTEALQTAARAENPNVQALLSRKALEGYGGGLEDIMGGARREGMGLYAPEYAALTEQEKMNWLAERERELMNYKAVLDKYYEQPKSGATAVSRTSPNHTIANTNPLSDFTSPNISNWGTSPTPTGTSTSYGSGINLALQQWLNSNPNATQGEMDAKRLQLGLPTNQPSYYDEYLKKNYMSSPSTEFNTFTSGLPSYTF